MKQKVLFIGREGPLINQLTTDFPIVSIEKLALEPDVIPTLLQLQKSGFSLVMIINQSFLRTDLQKSNNFLMNIFTSQGIVFEEVLICSSLPEDHCGYQNPHSYVISNKETDMKSAAKIGIAYLHYQREKLNWQAIGNQLTCQDRYAHVKRTTRETAINLELWLDREGDSLINTGISFFDHMLNQIATHGGLRMNISVQGDLHIDDHHTVEDTALALGEALNIALGDKQGIGRFGFVLPMDECLAICALDISGRPYLKYQAKYSYQRVGDLSTEMVEHFFRSLAYSMACTLHLRTKGKAKNDHHLVESLFKSFGRTLRQAIRVDGDTLPSSKGVL